MKSNNYKMSLLRWDILHADFDVCESIVKIKFLGGSVLSIVVHHGQIFVLHEIKVLA